MNIICDKWSNTNENSENDRMFNEKKTNCLSAMSTFHFQFLFLFLNRIPNLQPEFLKAKGKESRKDQLKALTSSAV